TIPYVRGWHDVEHCQALNEMRMIEREPVRNASATVMSRHRETRKAQVLHDRGHIARHRAFRVRRVIEGRRRTSAASVTAQVGEHDGELAYQQRRNAAPHQVRSRKTMQQQDRRPAACPSHDVSRLLGTEERLEQRISGTTLVEAIAEPIERVPASSVLI